LWLEHIRAAGQANPETKAATLELINAVVKGEITYVLAVFEATLLCWRSLL
jgi:hypothetical protein